MSKKKNKKIKKLEKALTRVLLERSQMRRDLSVLVYEPESHAGWQIKACVRMEDDMDRQMFFGDATDNTNTQGIWSKLTPKNDE